MDGGLDRAARSGVAAARPAPGRRGPGATTPCVTSACCPARRRSRRPWPAWAHPDVVAAFRARGIDDLWRHQAVAAEAARSGQHVVLSTGTASGKSLAYQLPALTAILERRGRQGRTRRVDALHQPDQGARPGPARGDRRRSGSACASPPTTATRSYDERDWTREHAEYVLTNPDMLHRSLLPRHDRWDGLFGSLDLVVVDECHHYRGVFGAHVAQVLRRLRRVCAHHGSDPTFVLASATVGNPAEHASRLTGLDVMAVSHDDSPRGEVALALWEPPLHVVRR